MKLTEKEQLKRDKLKYRQQVSKEKQKHKKQFSRSKLIEEADTVVSLYIRYIRDKDKPCITCGRFYDEYDCWHFQSRRFINTRFSELNIAKQCRWCNNWGSGEQLIFSRRIDEIHWQGTAEAIEILARQVSVIKDDDILEIIQKYYKILEENKIPYKFKKQFYV